jgi:hypothetical protein
MNDHNTEQIDYEDVLPFIRDGLIVPVISNSFRLEEIFRNDTELKLMSKHEPEFYDEAPTIDQQLSKTWAASNEYPMSDDHNLARVAQYLKVKKGPYLAKNLYLKFLSQRLLKNNQEREGYEGAGARTSFAKIVSEFDLPATFPGGREDPLLSLARLDLPIYITTSYFSFLEEALLKDGKHPSTQVFSWDNKSKIHNDHIPKREYEPDPLNPVVYHLFGLEEYPGSLVLSEDDYMDFLMKSASAASSLDVFPQPLRDALSQAPLLLLGYHLQSWDFRALFRFILEFRKLPNQDDSIALQFKPDLKNKEFEKNSLSYLESYFKGHHFNVKWMDPEEYLFGLSEAWHSRGHS